MLIISRGQLEAALSEYLDHYNSHRPHRALDQAAPLQALPRASPEGNVQVLRRDRLGGLIREYSQAA
jgi:transposase InsO family protein